MFICVHQYKFGGDREEGERGGGGERKGRMEGEKEEKGQREYTEFKYFLNLYPHIIYLILGSTIAAKVNQRELRAHRTYLDNNSREYECFCNGNLFCS